MRRTASVVTVLGLLAAGPAAAFALEAGVRGEYWFPSLSGDAGTTFGGLASADFDLKDTLGMQDEDFPFGEAFVGVSRFTFRVGYMQPRYEGSTTLFADLDLDGVVFPGGETIRSQLDLTIIDGQVQFDLLRPGVGVAALNLGLIVGVKYTEGSVQAQSATTGISARQDFQLPIPVIGAAAGAGFLKDLIRVDARATGLAYSGDHAYDVDAYASFAPLPFVRLQAGYRYLDIAIDESDIDVNVTLSGPYAGLQLSF